MECLFCVGVYYPNFTVMDFAVVQSKIRTVIITGIKKLIELSVELIEEIQSHVFKTDIAIYISTEVSTSTQTETKIQHR